MNAETWTTCRVSFTDDVDFQNAAAIAAAHAESIQPEASQPEPARAGPPPPIAEYSSIPQVSKTLPCIIMQAANGPCNSNQPVWFANHNCCMSSLYAS